MAVASSHWLVSLLAVSTLMFFVSSQAHAQSGLGELALGAALDKLGGELDQITLDAGNQARSTEIEGARDTSLAIAQVRNAYSDSLNTTVKNLRPQEIQTVDQLQSLVDGLESHTITTANDSFSRLQQITNTLPFRNGQPQVKDISPHFIATSSSQIPVRVVVAGNFIWAGVAQFRPTLTLNGHTYPANSQTNQLTFLIPANQIGSSNLEDKGLVTTTKASLLVPWRTGNNVSWALFHKKYIDRYDLVIGKLPVSPGKFTLIHIITSARRDTKTFTSNITTVCSTSSCGNNDQKDVRFSVSAENDPEPSLRWHVVRGSSGTVIQNSGGVHSGPSFISDDADMVVYSATTIHKGACSVVFHCGNSGYISYAIKFGEYRDVPIITNVSQPFTLDWGDQQVIPYPPGEWRLELDTFDGHHEGVAGAGTSQPFIQVQSSGGSDIVSAANPSTLNWP